MYMNQKCQVKLANELSESFTVANGVKQGTMISLLSFTFNIDKYLLKTTRLAEPYWAYVH